MSRIGIQPVEIPSGVKVQVDGQRVRIQGSKGNLEQEFDPAMTIVWDEDAREIRVDRPSDEPHERALHGLTRSLISNMVDGVTEGFEKQLEIRGVGYGARVEGSQLELQIGFSHPVEMDIPDDISVECPKDTKIVVRGPDKQQVGQFAANIRDVRPPEPYKGKGIRYVDERVRRKAGKAFGGGAA